jgi:hypothetical protein
MLWQAEIERVLGRRMVQRLRKSGWIAPVSTENRVVYYAERDLHRALESSIAGLSLEWPCPKRVCFRSVKSAQALARGHARRSRAR